MIHLPTQTTNNRIWEEAVGSPPGADPARESSAAPPLRPLTAQGWRSVLQLCQRQLVLLVMLVAASMITYQLVSHYVVTSVVVQGRSMTPTLQDGGHYLLNRLAYHFRDPRRDDLVVLRDPGYEDYAVKRVVGLPNDAILFKHGEVYVNGEKREEFFLARGTQTFCPDSNDRLVILGQNQYFVMGDNRKVSEDSRTYGAILRHQIIGLIAY